MTAFGVHVDRWDAAVVVAVRGPIDLSTAPVLRAVLHDLLIDVATVVVDLSATTLLDAHSAGTMVSTRRWARKHRSTLVLRALPSRAALLANLTQSQMHVSRLLTRSLAPAPGRAHHRPLTRRHP